MFRPQRVTKDSGYFEPFLPVTEELDTECITRNVSALGELPPPETHDLKRLIEAGVPLEQVSTRLIDSGAMPDIDKVFKKDTTKKDSDNDDNGVDNNE